MTTDDTAEQADTVEIPRAQLQFFEILYHAASEFYHAYYTSSVRLPDVASGNALADALSVFSEVDPEHGWEGWRLDKENDRLRQQVDDLQDMLDHVRSTALREMRDVIESLEHQWADEQG